MHHKYKFYINFNFICDAHIYILGDSHIYILGEDLYIVSNKNFRLLFMLCYNDYDNKFKDSCIRIVLLRIRIGFCALGQGGHRTTLLDLDTSKTCLASKNSKKTIPVCKFEIVKLCVKFEYIL